MPIFSGRMQTPIYIEDPWKWEPSDNHINVGCRIRLVFLGYIGLLIFISILGYLGLDRDFCYLLILGFTIAAPTIISDLLHSLAPLSDPN